MIDALRRAAGHGPYFRLDDDRPSGGPPWRTVASLYTGEGIADLIATYLARIGSDQARVAASLLFQGYAARLFSPALATLTAGAGVPELPPADLYWRYVDGQPLQLSLASPRAAADGDLARVVLRDNLLPFAEALRRVVPISPKVLIGNAASALAGAARTIGAEPTARALLAGGVLRGTYDWPLRRSCCLYYRVPGGGTCGDCVLNAVDRR